MLTAQQIRHVFVLMLENHSFDHMLGFSGLSGTDAVTGKPRTVPKPSGTNPYRGTNYAVGSPGVNPMRLDPGHEFTDVVEQLGGPGAKYPHGGPYPHFAGTGFAANYASQQGFGGAARPDDPLRCFARSQVPVITALAEEFVLCSAWFSSMPGPTWPNRYFVHAGSSGGLDHSPSSMDIAYYMTFGFEFQHGTIFDRLEAKRIPWRIYRGDLFPQAFSMRHMTEYFLEGHIADYRRFADDLDRGYQPVYTFIEPSYGAVMSDYTCGTSQHPLDDVARGEWLIKRTYEAIRSSPVWDSSLLIVTWDEHGGFYDHVNPPFGPTPYDQPRWASNNRSGFTFTKYGVRVPAVVVSPFTRPNLIDPRTYDHATVLATVERLYGIPALTRRDRLAADLRSLGTLPSPRKDAPTELPDPAPPAPMRCGPISGVAQMPSAADAHEMLRTRTAPAEPIEGTQAGFVHAALMQDLAISTPEEREERRARAAEVRTKEDARQYLLEVADRVHERSPEA